MTGTTTDPVVTTYVEYLHPGSLWPEETTAPTEGRDPQRAASQAPETAFAFRFFDKVTMTIVADGEETELASPRTHLSGTYYIDADELTAADVAALPGDHRILRSNMRANRWEKVARCRTGNFRPLLDGDAIIRTGEGQ